MPIHWTAQSMSNLVTVIAEGDVVKGDVEAFLDLLIGANLAAWSKLIDARAARFVFTSQEVNEIGVRLRAAHAEHSIGPLAFVMPEAKTPEVMRLLGFLAAAERPMRVFQEFAPAQKWIHKAGSCKRRH